MGYSSIQELTICTLSRHSLAKSARRLLSRLIKLRSCPCEKRKNRRVTIRRLELIVFPFTLLVCGTAGDWPRFRGPNGAGVADTAGLPDKFGPDQNVFWKTSLPLGHSSPVLTSDRVFLTGVDHDKLYTFCL